MARFYGTIQGSRGPASRLGHKHLEVNARSYSGDVRVTLYAPDAESSTDHVCIAARDHDSSGDTVTLYRGPIRDLLAPHGREELVRKMAHDMLEQEHRKAKGR